MKDVTGAGSIQPDSPAGGWLENAWAVLDAEGIILEATGPLCAWLGLPTPVPTGLRLWTLLGERCPEAQATLAPLASRADSFAAESLCLGGDPEHASRWYHLERVRHGTSTFVRVASILPPRTELSEASWDAHLGTDAARREMFVRLLRAEARQERMIEHWPGVIFSQRADGSFEFVSPQIESLTGVPVSQWSRQSQWLWQVVHEADVADLQLQMQHAARTGRPVTSTFRVRHLQSGRVSYVLEHRHPILSHGGLLFGYEGVWLDITRQTIAEKRLSSAAWKETLAVLTMGLAHDFGNIMAGIHSLSESFLEQLEEAHPFREGLSLIKKNSLQASQLVHRIINLHVGKTGDRNYHDLNEILEELHDLVRKILPRRIQLEVVRANGQLPLYVDAFEFRQTIINLTLNAADAMPETGRLRLTTSRHTSWPAPEHVHGVRPRMPCVCLSVQDSGVGIRTRHLDSIFDPFFTTKSANKGSGLGLYNARLFAEKHQGALSVESVEGEGSTFHLWLPEADFTEGERLESPVATSTPAPRRLSLLLVSPPGRRLDDTAELLRTKGYHVVTATQYDAALALLRAEDCICSGMVVLMEADDAPLTSFLSTVRRQHPLLKVILRPVGRDDDDFRSGLLKHADVAVSSLARDEDFLEQIRNVLQAEG